MTTVEKIKYHILSWYEDEGEYQPTKEEATKKVERIIKKEITSALLKQREELKREVEKLDYEYSGRTDDKEGDKLVFKNDILSLINKQT